MRSAELDFSYPDSLVALERATQSRVMLVAGEAPYELKTGVTDLIELCQPGDLLVLNDTRVLPRRLFTEEGLEVLFLRPCSTSKDETISDWQVLCPATRWKSGTLQTLPGGLKLELLARGKPQTVRVLRESTASGNETSSSSLLPPSASVSSSRSVPSTNLSASPAGKLPFALSENYFVEHGDLPLPPYIQKARGERRNRVADTSQYQTDWARVPGSLAAPTASFHFQNHHLDLFRARGGTVAKITLHVGLGTFLPVAAASLDEHVMHSESVEISAETWRLVCEAKSRGSRVWCLGTTVTRALEAAAHGRLHPLPPVSSQDLLDNSVGGWCGETDLFIQPGFEFRITDVLCTNFHQPKSTLLALTAAFAGLEKVKRSYHWAIENRFRLFSYGDLCVWLKP